jgi:dolichol-phosphate mannosyltransferase
MSIWTVIPTYDEAENVEAIVAAVRTALAFAAPERVRRILIVDDNSPDGTGLIADDLARRHPDVRVLHRPGKAGIAAAYAAGMAHALDHGATLVVQMDADFSHDPGELPRLLGAIADGADVVLGSRYVPGARIEGWPRSRRLISRGGGRYASLLLGLHVNDPTGGFKCFRADALRAIGLDGLQAGGYAFQIETTYRATRLGLRVVEVPITFRDRTRGASKMSAAIALEAAWRTPLLRFSSAGRALQRPAVAGPGAHAAVDHVPHLAGSVPLHERRARRRPLP